MGTQEKTYNIVYKTTDLTNGYYYIGVHSTDTLHDGYLGSGTRLKSAINKRGAENFKREVLFKFKTRKEALKKEKEIVDDNRLLDMFCYNLVTGGGGSSTPTRTKAKKYAFKKQLFEKFDEKHAFIFTPNKEKIEEYNRYIASLKDEKARRLQTMLNGVMDHNAWARLFTQGYNNKHSNKEVLSILTILARKNMIDMYNIVALKWDEELEEKIIKHHE